MYSRKTAARLLLLPLSLLSAACSSGGKSGEDDPQGDDPQGEVAIDPTGVWNLFREADGCEGDEFAALPMEIRQRAGGSFEVAIGEAGEQFVFDAALDGRVLQVSGESEVDGTSISVGSNQQANWTVAADQNSLAGTMRVSRIETGFGGCEFTDRITAFRADATDQSVIAGEWVWNLTTVESSGPCSDDVGNEETILVELLPRRADEFTLNVITPNGGMFQLDAALEGEELRVSGGDSFLDLQSTEIAESVEVLAGTSLQFDSSTQRISGQLEITTSDGEACTQLFSVAGARLGDFMPTKESFQVFLEDAAGDQRLVGVDPTDPSVRIDLDGQLGFTGIDFSSDVTRFAAISVRGELDEDTGEISAAQPDKLFYLVDDSLLAIDLVQERNGFGELRVPEPRTVTSASGARDLRVFSSPASKRTIVTFTAINSNDRIAVVDEDGTQDTNGMQPNGDVLFGTHDPDTGELRGVIVQDEDGRLHRVLVDENQQISEQAASHPIRADDGSVYFLSDSELLVYRSDIEGTGLLGDIQGRFEAPTTIGSSLFFLKPDPSGGLMEVVQSNKTFLLTITSVGNAAQAALLDPALVATPSRIVFQYTNDLGQRETRTVQRNVGPTVSSPLAINTGLRLDTARVMGEVLYFQPVPFVAKALALRADGSEQAEFDGSWIGIVPQRSWILSERAEPQGILLVDGDLLQVVGADSPFDIARTLGDGGFSDLISLVFVAVNPAPGSGARMLIENGGDAAFLDASVEASLVELTDSLNQLDVPLF